MTETFAFDEEFAATNADICRFSRRVLGQNQLTGQLLNLICISHKHLQQWFKYSGEPVAGQPGYTFFSASQMQQVVWHAQSGGAILTAIRKGANQWQLRYQGSGKYEETYFRLLAEIIPHVNPSMSICTRMVARSHAMSKGSSMRKKRVGEWVKILLSTEDANEALQKLPDRRLRNYLGTIPPDMFAIGLRKLRQQLQIAA